ncbi:hypothetical protein HK098_001439 [Nowakowskiella sp. JEL0407]|nr:hypothetical protein HK098_001439 [Nowakowskiella sp. JEL0407]
MSEAKKRAGVEETMEHITPFINKIDKSVSEYPTFISLEKTTGIPKGYLALVGGVALALITLFDLGAQFFTNLILIAYPALRILDLNHSAVTAAANEKNGINIAQKTIIDMYEPYAKKLMNEKTE